MALGKLVETIEFDFRRSRQNVTLKERLLQEKKNEVAELRKSIATQEEQIRVIKNQNEQNASTVAMLNEDINLRRTNSLRHEQHVDILVQRNRSLENDFRKKEEKIQMEFHGTEDLLQIQLNRYQTLPKSQTLTKMEQELLRLQNLIKVLTMKEDNAAQGLTRAEAPDAAVGDTTSFREFCVALAQIIVGRSKADTQNLKQPRSPMREEAEQSDQQNVVQMDADASIMQTEIEDIGMEVDSGDVPTSVISTPTVRLEEPLAPQPENLASLVATDDQEMIGESLDEDVLHFPDVPQEVVGGTVEGNCVDVEIGDKLMVKPVECLQSAPRNTALSGILGTEKNLTKSNEKNGFFLPKSSVIGSASKVGIPMASPSAGASQMKPCPAPAVSKFTPAAMPTSKTFKIPLRPVEKMIPVRAGFFAQPDSPVHTLDTPEFTGFDLFDKPTPTSPHEKDKALAGPFGGFFGALSSQATLSEGSDDGFDAESMFGNYGGSNQQGTSEKFNSGFKLNF